MQSDSPKKPTALFHRDKSPWLFMVLVAPTSCVKTFLLVLPLSAPVSSEPCNTQVAINVTGAGGIYCIPFLSFAVVSFNLILPAQLFTPSQQGLGFILCLASSLY